MRIVTLRLQDSFLRAWAREVGWALFLVGLLIIGALAAFCGALAGEPFEDSHTKPADRKTPNEQN